jgi:hypothetical protein
MVFSVLIGFSAADLLQCELFVLEVTTEAFPEIAQPFKEDADLTILPECIDDGMVIVE